MPVEDFLTYTEVDNENNITRTATRVSWIQLAIAKFADYVYKDYGIGFFRNLMTFEFTIQFDAATNASYMVHWSLANVIKHWILMQTDNDHSIALTSVLAAGEPQLHLTETGGSGDNWSTTDLTLTGYLGLPLYIRIVLDPAVGANGTFYLYVYSDAARTNEIGAVNRAFTFPIGAGWRYIYAAMTHRNVSTDNSLWHTGFTENLSFYRNLSDPLAISPGSRLAIADMLGGGNMLDARFTRGPSCILFLPMWKKDGTAFRTDDAYGHLCTVTGATWKKTGRLFDGVDDKITVALNNVLRGIGNSSFTVSVWAKTSATTSGVTVMPLLDFLGQNATAGYNILRINSGPSFGGQVRLEIYDGANNPTCLGTTDLRDGRWHHLVGVRINRTRLQVYVDGVRENETNDTTTGTVSGGGTGTTTNGGDYNVPFDGEMGEVLIHNRPLTATEIMKLFRQTKWRYAGR